MGYGAKSVDEEIETIYPGASIRDDGSAIYRVRDGDTPIGIASQYGLSLEELYELNSEFSPNSILRIDQELIVGRIPIPVEVGGSTDMPTATTIIPATFTPEATAEPSPRPSEPSPSATPTTQVPMTVSSDTADESQSSIDDNMPILLVFIGVVLLLAAIGGALLYLGRK